VPPIIVVIIDSRVQRSLQASIAGLPSFMLSAIRSGIVRALAAAEYSHIHYSQLMNYCHF
jgi:hypothetical protein